MLYLTGIYALNIEDSLDTCGDWHTSSLDWTAIKLKDTQNSLLDTWGIEQDKLIPEHNTLFNVANTLRAILDLMIEGNTNYLKNFRNDFICTDKYNQEFFEKVFVLQSLSNWSDIDKLMEKEFMWLWREFKNKRGV